MKKETKRVWVLLDEDRGSDTGVYIYFNKAQAVKHFNDIVNDIETYLGDDMKEDKDSFNMVSKYHLQYDLEDSWGNIELTSKPIPGGNHE